ncbi:unnamed protein product [Rangifer tarandus platyrhynchus]|uniref:Uncharacterized protein n=1 Tax=Rangifer tarandus platyrhynchus TaxID=3082113 RepID=A0AC59Z1K8_RANTA
MKHRGVIAVPPGSEPPLLMCGPHLEGQHLVPASPGRKCPSWTHTWGSGLTVGSCWAGALVQTIVSPLLESLGAGPGAEVPREASGVQGRGRGASFLRLAQRTPRLGFRHVGFCSCFP